jgi:hypothetical protein
MNKPVFIVFVCKYRAFCVQKKIKVNKAFKSGNTRTGFVAQVVECSPSKHKVLTSIDSTKNT